MPEGSSHAWHSRRCGWRAVAACVDGTVLVCQWPCVLPCVCVQNIASKVV